MSKVKVRVSRRSRGDTTTTEDEKQEDVDDDAVSRSLCLIESTSTSVTGHTPRSPQRPPNDVDEMAIVVALDRDDRRGHRPGVRRRGVRAGGVAGGSSSGRDSFRTAVSHVDRAPQSINHK